MGLDFSHCDAHWAYSGFMRFRCRLAQAVGIGDYREVRTTTDPRFQIIKKDPIKYLLAHSDCDGHLTVRQCKLVAPRLKELISGWEESDYDKAQALILIKGMKRAIAKNQRLEFR